MGRRARVGTRPKVRVDGEGDGAAVTHRVMLPWEVAQDLVRVRGRVRA